MQLIHEIPTLPPRKPTDHKGTFGKVLVIGGSRGMSGAVGLTGLAALRSGAGLVQIAVPSEIQSVVASYNPCYMTFGLPGDDRGRVLPASINDIKLLAESADILAIGPGLGQSSSMPLLLEEMFKIDKPIVLDADGLNALVSKIDCLGSRKQPTILTPHPGEFARLINKSTGEVQANRESLSLAFACERKVILVLKGHETLVTDGERLYRNSTGNPGMATGGSGDVLTGMISALLGQGLSPLDAAQLGVFLHGRVGDLAANDLSQVSMIASDLIDSLPDAFLSLTR